MYNGQRIKLADFGMAKETDGSSLQALTKTGTFQYMAPELVESKTFQLQRNFEHRMSLRVGGSLENFSI